MKRYFADSFYWFALMSAKDQAHERALQFAQQSISIITTSWILTEVADGYCKAALRPRFLSLLGLIENDPNHFVLPPDQLQYDQGLTLYSARPDKDWSLTDCISFIAMDDYKLTDALTADSHFTQAGFNALLA